MLRTCHALHATSLLSQDDGTKSVSLVTDALPESLRINMAGRVSATRMTQNCLHVGRMGDIEVYVNGSHNMTPTQKAGAPTAPGTTSHGLPTAPCVGWLVPAVADAKDATLTFETTEINITMFPEHVDVVNHNFEPSAKLKIVQLVPKKEFVGKACALLRHTC